MHFTVDEILNYIYFCHTYTCKIICIQVSRNIEFQNHSTAISIDEGGEEQIFENLNLHKEVLHGVKQQPWPLRKKLKLVRQAKSYVRKHEGALQERLAQTRSTRDAIARASILLTKV